jgi:two-component system chemotaxis response regulator CheY
MQILVVDDSKAMRSIVMRAVRQAGYESVTFVEAANGAEALRVIRGGAPALVLADWNMPEMSGIELLQALRAEGNAVKLGFVTSESDPAMRDLAFQAGAAFMLTKPFTPDAFKAVLGPVLA